jgi:hypothetical protein
MRSRKDVVVAHPFLLILLINGNNRFADSSVKGNLLVVAVPSSLLS